MARYRLVGALFSVALMVTGVQAQTNSSILGTVKDATGAVLPGVTIEASSPALIEKVRNGVTDGAGQYRIIELRPGVYSVTFTLPGFSTVRLDGIELTTGFAATVNAELRLGSIAETITISGQSPVVDTQNVVSQRVMTREVIDAIPTAKNFANLAILIPGVTVTGSGTSFDVGGSKGHNNQMLMIHGSRSGDQVVLVDGMSVANLEVSGAYTTMAFPDGNIEEINVGVGAHVAEMETGGVRVDMIPKSGGNRYGGSLFGTYTNEHLASSNLSDDLKSRGLTAVNRVRYISDINPSIGGPIVKDRVWFFGGYRNWRTAAYTTLYPDTNPADWVYTPDRSKGNVPRDSLAWNGSGRLTWQVSSKDKVSVNLTYDNRCECTNKLAGLLEPTTMPEAGIVQNSVTKLAQATWVRPATSRFLLEGGISTATSRWTNYPVPGAVGPPALELSNNFGFRSRGVPTGLNEAYALFQERNFVIRGSGSYVTGAHAFKIGGAFDPPNNSSRIDRHVLGDYLVVLLNGAANRAEYFAMPFYNRETMRKLAAYAQDQWRVNRLTLNLGLRLDWHESGYADVDLAATRLLPARHFTGADVLDWKDLSPRLGTSLDLFGTGKTSLKVSVSRYLSAETTGLARSASPVVTSTARLVRQWSDFNGDFIPDGDPLNPLPNGELIGPSTNTTFGKPITTLRYDPDWARGWGLRGFNWETSAGIQHQLFPHVALNGAYVRRQYGNFSVTDNVAVAPSDYDSFCITAPTNAAFPGGGGQSICGLYDINPTKVGVNDRVQTLASKYGRQTEYWQGGDVSIDARLGNGVLLQGGLSTGTTVTDNCDVVTKIDNPSQLYCHRVLPRQNNVKLLGSYMLPRSIQVSAAFQSIPGASASANYVATNASILPSLKRNLAAGANGTVSVNVVEPGTLFGDTTNQLDLRVARTFPVARARVRVMLDVYNVSNAASVVGWNNTYGTTGAGWLAPQETLAGRLVKFSAQMDF